MPQTLSFSFCFVTFASKTMVKGTPAVLPVKDRLTEWAIPTIEPPIKRALWATYLKDEVVRYAPPMAVTVLGDSKGWLQVYAFGPQDGSKSGVGSDFRGVLLLPSRYEELWRSLLYSCIFNEAILEFWDKETASFANNKNPKGQEAVKLRCRHNAAVKAVQFVIYRRYVVEELLALPLEAPPHHLKVLTEVALRDLRDWHFTSFEKAVEENKKAFKLDPISDANRAFFRKTTLY
jgi:hypothetical protein